VATFFVNTDAKSNEGESYHDAWVARGIAVTSGRVKFRQKLARIARGDTVLMYANGVGVVAVGTALDDEVMDVTDENALVSPRESIEYHRRVDWHSDLRSAPISGSTLRELCGRAPRQVVERLEKGEGGLLRLVAQLAAQRSMINLDGEHIEEHGSFPEGAVRRVSINAYERNPDARRACVSRYGAQCAA
jgi:putative restriction endonuclease